ncbi:WD40-repeat-containing domain protein [Protomyces lactucae-debilis]|uniref:WD40-repeat-containing domain protein n=1 Tax=Protomyces lactucae-debilis TaxID=2754530 RepID=A0A1Y2FQA9_PROLT|nr:WD40-repeat-containing domain protein [Protomyces lactucae-debilis]ORY86191.1 WD40-repeat-containing domain protein [Protomyces lactucae-debilis]
MHSPGQTDIDGILGDNSTLAPLSRPNTSYSSPSRPSFTGKIPAIMTNGVLLTPEGRRESQLDPLSAHILQRTGTGFNGTPEDSPIFKRNPSDTQKREESPVLVEVDHKERKKRVSFFAKLRGKDHHADEHVEDPEDLSRAEGAEASTFCGCSHSAKPPYIRVRAHKKSKRDFNNVFLAQELKPKTSEEGGAIWSMKFSPDGRYLAVGGQDCVVRVWRVLASPSDRLDNDTAGSKLNAPVFMEKPYREYAAHEGDILDLSWSKNNFLLSSSMDKTVRLWHVSQEECLCCFQHTDFVTAIAFHPKDDRFFLSGSLDCKLRLWSIVDKTVSYWNELPELITAVAFSPEGRVAIAGSFSGLCLFYETEGLRYHTQMHVRSARGKNKNGSKITGLEAFLWKAGDGSSDVKLLVTSNDSRVRLYNLRDKSLEMKFKGNANSASQIRASISEDRRHVVCGSEDKHVYIWDTHRQDNNEKKERLGYERFEAHTEIVSATCFAPQRSRELLVASGDPIYDLVQRSRNRSHTIESTSSSINGDRESLSSLITAGEGHVLITADYLGIIKVFRQDAAASLRFTGTRDSVASDAQSQKRLRRRLSTISTSTGRSATAVGTPEPKQALHRAASVASLDSTTTTAMRKPHEAPAPASPARSNTAGTGTASTHGTLSTSTSMPPPQQIGHGTSRQSFFPRSGKHAQEPATEKAKDVNDTINPGDYLDANGVSYGYYSEIKQGRMRRRSSLASGASLERVSTAQSVWTNGSADETGQGDLSTMVRTQSQEGSSAPIPARDVPPGAVAGASNHKPREELVCRYCRGVTFTAVRHDTGVRLSCSLCFTVMET